MIRRVLAAVLRGVAAPFGRHLYLSSYCLHGLVAGSRTVRGRALHGECGAKQRERGEVGAPHCKSCDSVCLCPFCRHRKGSSAG